MFRFMKFAVVLAGLVALLRVPDVRSLVDRAQHMVRCWIPKPGPADLSSVKSQIAGIENRLAQVQTETEQLGATAQRSEREAGRLGDLLGRTKGDIVVVQADGRADEFPREDLQLEQAVFVVSGAAAKIEQSALAEEANQLLEKHRQLKSRARRETAKAIAEMLEEMPRAEGKSLAGDKR